MADGAYFNAYDTIPECYKFIEDVITNSDINQDFKRLTFGLSFDSEQFFNKQTRIYDIDGPKNLMNSDQLSDWYLKQCKEHPNLTYLEDPFQEGKGYKVITAKLQDLPQKVDVCVKQLINSDLNILKDVTTFVEQPLATESS